MSIEDKYLQAFEWCINNSKITETKKKESFIHVATELGLDKLVGKLIQKGVDVNCQDIEKYTPLHFAAGKGHIEIAKQLLVNKADVNCQTDCKMTPLHFAALNGHLEVAKELLENKADINCGNEMQIAHSNRERSHRNRKILN